jgi:hypothetical protein
MGIFGWSLPPGCESVPGDEPEPDPAMLTVREFTDHIGCGNLGQALRAIDKHTTEAVDVWIEGTDEWITPGSSAAETCSPHDPIEKLKVRGIAWDDSDWEWVEIVPGDGDDPLAALDSARQGFHDALDEWHAIREDTDARLEDH